MGYVKWQERPKWEENKERVFVTSGVTSRLYDRNQTRRQIIHPTFKEGISPMTFTSRPLAPMVVTIGACFLGTLLASSVHATHDDLDSSPYSSPNHLESDPFHRPLSQDSYGRYVEPNQQRGYDSTPRYAPPANPNLEYPAPRTFNVYPGDGSGRSSLCTDDGQGAVFCIRP